MPQLQAVQNDSPECVLLIDELVDRSLSLSPESVAFIYQDKKLTRTELHLHIQKVAADLSNLGVVANEPVAVFIEHSLELVTGMLGVLAAGACCVPLDPSLPPARTQAILEDISPRVIVTIDSDAKLAVNPDTVFLNINLQQAVAQQPLLKQHLFPRSGEDLAFIVYTSGSTGGPKGVEICHDSYCKRLVSAVDKSPVRSTDVDLLWTPASFIVMLDELLFPVLSGMPAVIVSPRLRMDPLALSALIYREKINFLRLTPSLLRMLILAGNLYHYKSIRTFFCSGELLPLDLQQMFFKKIDADLYSFYGSTEAPGVLYWKYESGEKPFKYTQGYLTDTAKIKILRGDKTPAATDEVGEIYIGGQGLARGYWNKPELTGSRFVQTDTKHGGEDVWFRTGDLGRKQAGGIYEVLGRCDRTEVNIHGVRINLDEIETSVLSLKGVDQAAVTIYQSDKGSSQQLVLHWVASEDSLTTEEKILQYLQRAFPAHMVPEYFIQHQQFELTANGKIDRLFLAAITPAKAIILKERRSDHLSPPQNPVEKKLLTIWRQILRLDEIGVKDDFFSLGGSSLQAVLMFTEIEKQFGFHQPVSMLAEKPTIRLLAESVSRDKPDNYSSLIIPLKLTGSKEPIFLIHARDGNVLFYRELAETIDRDRPVYGVQSIFLFELKYKPETLAKLASRYVEAIMKIQPHGPYNILGRCFGGVVATEIAQQFLNKGECVNFLGVQDSPPPKVAGGNDKVNVQKKAATESSRQGNVGIQEKIFLHLKDGDFFSICGTYAGNYYRKFEYNLRTYFYLNNAVLIQAGFRFFIGDNRYKQTRTSLLNSQLFNAHYPGYYRGKIVLLLSSEFARDPKRTRRKPLWSKLCQNRINCHIIEAGHRTIMHQPNVARLGALIKDEIDS